MAIVNGLPPKELPKRPPPCYRSVRRPHVPGTSNVGWPRKRAWRQLPGDSPRAFMTDSYEPRGGLSLVLLRVSLWVVSAHSRHSCDSQLAVSKVGA